MNFIIFNYKNTNDYGIAINPKILVGNINEIKKYQWIKYVDSIKLQDNPIEYHGIVFYNLDQEYAETIKELMEKEWEKDDNFTISKMMKNLSEAFKKIKSKNNLKIYLQLMADMLLIKKCENLNYDIDKFYSYGSPDNFNFSNNGKISTKHGIKANRLFLIDSQAIFKLFKKENNQLIVILTEFDEYNGIDLLELFQSIKNNKNNNLIAAQEKIMEIKEMDEKLFLNVKVVIDKSQFLLIDKDYLPNIKMKENNCLVYGKFKLFITEEMGFQLENHLKDIINEN